jgi:hypothetical protein
MLIIHATKLARSGPERFLSGPLSPPTGSLSTYVPARTVLFLLALSSLDMGSEMRPRIPAGPVLS